jgi:hypothetical protein
VISLNVTSQGEVDQASIAFTLYENNPQNTMGEEQGERRLANKSVVQVRLEKKAS